MRISIKTLKELHGVDFNKLPFYEFGNQEANDGDVWLEVSIISAYESLNYTREPLYHKTLEGVGNPSASYAISYVKRVDECNYERYDLAWEEVPQSIKDDMLIKHYQLSLSVKLKMSREGKG